MNYANIFAKMFPERNFCKVNMFPVRKFQNAEMFPVRKFIVVCWLFPSTILIDNVTSPSISTPRAICAARGVMIQYLFYSDICLWYNSLTP